MDGTDKVSICNQALSHLAVGLEIQDLDTDTSKEAQACRRFYDAVRQEILRKSQWPFAGIVATLALVAGTGTSPASTEWQYSYQLPSDYLRIRRLLSGTRTDNQDSRVPYRIIGQLLYTDFAPVAATTTTPALPQIEYTANISDEGTFAPDFADALAFRLAWKIAPRVTKGDQFKLGDRAYKNYVLAMEEANANAFNEEQLDRVPESEFINARE